MSGDLSAALMAPLSIRAFFGIFIFIFLFIIFLLIILVIFNFTTILFFPCMGIFVMSIFVSTMPLHRHRSSVGPSRGSGVEET